MKAVAGLPQPNNAKPIADSSFPKAKPEDSLDSQFKPPEASQLVSMKILEGNAGALTNFEVLDFLRAKGASKDPTRVIAKVAQSEYKVYDYLVDTAASVQTRESINEFLTSVK
ncbi:hypothetical protein glysoja_049488 [Glycine soja]|uniref:DNA-directed RNA polymerase III subunit RPC9 n=1 Tax=Glycine soja TaxID=3848 RepID=A0A0B2QQ91_GLYSO|nr:hypothetical protein glysoja_049488 [Glycine soja]